VKNVPYPTRGSFLVPVPDPPGTGTTRGPVPAGYTRYPLGSITTGVHSCHSTEIEMMIILLFYTANDLLHMAGFPQVMENARSWKSHGI
jgi:hypothetical protein